MRSVALELAVREGSFLERSERGDAVVRQAQDAQPEQSDDDDQQRRANERDEQLGVDLGRQATDGTDERVVARIRQPPFDDRRRSLPGSPSVGHGFRA